MAPNNERRALSSTWGDALSPPRNSRSTPRRRAAGAAYRRVRASSPFINQPRSSAINAAPAIINRLTLKHLKLLLAGCQSPADYGTSVGSIFIADANAPINTPSAPPSLRISLLEAHFRPIYGAACQIISSAIITMLSSAPHKPPDKPKP